MKQSAEVHTADTCSISQQRSREGVGRGVGRQRKGEKETRRKSDDEVDSRRDRFANASSSSTEHAPMPMLTPPYTGTSRSLLGKRNWPYRNRTMPPAMLYAAIRVASAMVPARRGKMRRPARGTRGGRRQSSSADGEASGSKAVPSMHSRPSNRTMHSRPRNRTTEDAQLSHHMLLSGYIRQETKKVKLIEAKAGGWRRESVEKGG